MEFIDDNLTKEDIRKSLELMRQGIEFYKSEYRNRMYIYDTSYNTISINFCENVIPHLLGYDINAKYTWFEYISSKKLRINSLEWLEEFVKSSEFIEYMIFTKKEPPLVNFSKIRFKSQHFCSISLRKNPCFFI